MRTVNRSGKSGREVAHLLGRRLDDRFTLAHRVRMRGLEQPVDAVLVGPHGVTVLALADDQGRVRSLGDNWYIWNQKTNNFDPSPYNPIKKVQQDRAAMETHVNARQMGSVIPVDCAVLVPSPKAQVEFMQPTMPILDASRTLEFAEQLAGQRELIEWSHAEELLKSLGVPPLGIPWRQLGQAGARTRKPAPVLWGLTRQQLVLLGVIAAADVLVLIAGALIVLLR
jgi:hypothetical protein